MIIKLLLNNKGVSFLEVLLWIVLVIFVVAIPLMDLSGVISNVFVSMIDRVNQIGTP